MAGWFGPSGDCGCGCDCGGTCLNGFGEVIESGLVSQIDLVIDGLPTEIYFGRGVILSDRFLGITAANLEGTYSIIENECVYQSFGTLSPADFSLRVILDDNCGPSPGTTFPLTINSINYTAQWDLQPYNLPGVGAPGLELIISVNFAVFGGSLNSQFRFVPNGAGMACAGGDLKIDAGAGESAPCSGYENPATTLSTYELFS